MSASVPTGSPRRNLALSPGGGSFENYIYRPEARRRQQRSYNRPKKVVHRNLEYKIPEYSEADEVDVDPIRNVRKAAGYQDLVEKCEPGQEIRRYI